MFYGEAARVLATGGALCLLYNNRSLYDDPLMAAFETLVEETVDGYDRAYRTWDLLSETRAIDWAAEVKQTRHPWTWRLSPEDFAGLMLSRSKMRPFVDVHGVDRARALILDLAAVHRAVDGLVDVEYSTQVVLVRR